MRTAREINRELKSLPERSNKREKLQSELDEVLKAAPALDESGRRILSSEDVKNIQSAPSVDERLGVGDFAKYRDKSQPILTEKEMVDAAPKPVKAEEEA